VFMLNTQYLDGTRLRTGPRVDDEFSGQFVLNDQQVEILALEDRFAKIRSCGEGVPEATTLVEGWVRTRNLSAVKRKAGLAPSLLTKAASSGLVAVVSAAAEQPRVDTTVADTSSTHDVEELNIEIRDDR
jgi:hypothetical protein